MNRQIGRILQQNQRAAARFSIALEPDGCPAGFRLTAGCNASFDDWAALSEGAYLSAFEHRQLDRSADSGRPISSSPRPRPRSAFRKISSTYRPIWHQHADRVQAHILVCFLAFVLWKTPRDVAAARQASEIRRVRSSKSSRESSRMTWSCRSPPMAQIRLRCVTQPDARTSRSPRPPRRPLAQTHAPRRTRGAAARTPPPEYANSPEM